MQINHLNKTFTLESVDQYNSMSSPGSIYVVIGCIGLQWFLARRFLSVVLFYFDYYVWEEEKSERIDRGQNDAGKTVLNVTFWLWDKIVYSN